MIRGARLYIELSGVNLPSLESLRQHAIEALNNALKPEFCQIAVDKCVLLTPYSSISIYVKNISCPSEHPNPRPWIVSAFGRNRDTKEDEKLKGDFDCASERGAMGLAYDWRDMWFATDSNLIQIFRNGSLVETKINR